MRVRIIKRPPAHATGRDSGPCTCRGKTGTLVNQPVSNGLIAIVRLDKGGRVGLPIDCIQEITSD
jgi:hypothetical protein